MLNVYKIETHETAMLERIIQIHDEMPLAWDPTHHVSRKFLNELRDKIQANTKPQGLWILCRTGRRAPEEIEGTIWASIESSFGVSVCSINSFWISEQLRGQNLAPRLTEPCLSWARGLGAKTIECATHTDNGRLRGILAKNGFKPGMIRYSLAL